MESKILTYKEWLEAELEKITDDEGAISMIKATPCSNFFQRARNLLNYLFRKPSPTDVAYFYICRSPNENHVLTMTITDNSLTSHSHTFTKGAASHLSRDLYYISEELTE